MLDNLIRLGRILGEPAFEEAAQKLSAAFHEAVHRAPEAHTHYLAGLHFAFGPSIEVVVAGEPDDSKTRELVDAAREGYHPHLLILLKTAENAERLARLAPFTANQNMLRNAPTAYVCAANRCSRPVHSAAEIKANIRKLLQSGVNDSPKT